MAQPSYEVRYTADGTPYWDLGAGPPAPESPAAAFTAAISHAIGAHLRTHEQDAAPLPALGAGGVEDEAL
jgi:hypothetical protein